jgi:hypothetical protein
MDTQSMQESAAQGAAAQSPWPGRLDWRTGKVVYSRDAQFWRAHERRRVEQGLTVAAYCKANDLASSTFRRRARGDPEDLRRGGADASGRPRPSPTRAGRSASAQADAGDLHGARFVALQRLGCDGAAGKPGSVRVHTARGLVIELAGPAADSLVQRLLQALP